jgi:predicted CoA-binding protein
MNTKKDIEKFLGPKKLAIAGVSRNPKKFGYQIYGELKKRGYEVYPVNPQTSEIAGVTCYRSVSDLPAGVDRLLIVTPKQQTDAVLREAIKKGIPHVWVQQMSETKDTLKIAEENHVDLIAKKCIFMFADPVQSIHKFHRTLAKWFGRLPK